MKIRTLLVLSTLLTQTSLFAQSLTQAREYEIQGLYQEARSCLDTLLLQQQDHIPTLQISARIHQALQDEEKAIDDYIHILALDSTHVSTLVALGDLMRERGFNNDAEGYYEEALTAAPDRLGIRLKLAKHYMNGHSYHAAVALLKPAIRKHPDTILLKSLISDCFVNLKKWQDAADWADQGLAIDSMHYKCRLNGGMAYFELNKKDTARVYLEAAVHINPKSGKAYHYLGEIAFANDDIHQCISHHEASLELGGPLALKSMKLLTKYYFHKKDFASAQQNGIQYLATDPQDAFTFHFMARSESDLGMITQATEHFNKALLYSNQDFLKMTYFFRALNFFQLKEFGRAIKDYRTVIALDPAFPYAHYNLAVTYDEYYEDKKSAIKGYEDFLELAKTHEVDRDIVEAAENRIAALKEKAFLKSK